MPLEKLERTGYIMADPQLVCPTNHTTLSVLVFLQRLTWAFTR